MAMNPMQKKARTSFLLGMLLTLLITGIIIGFLIYKLGQEKQKQASIVYKQVYVASKEIKSGEKLIGTDDFENTNLKLVYVDASLVPSNALTLANADTYLSNNTTVKVGTEINTVITESMLNLDGEQLSSDLRLQEYNMVILPTFIQPNECIDIRLRLPTGEDYIVLSKKYVEKTSDNTVWIKVREDEILTMSNAIVEAYIMNGSLLYATTYTDAGLQSSSTPTYIARNSVINLMNADPNITAIAKNALASRYNEEARAQRDLINQSVNKFTEDALENVQEKTQEEIQKQQTARQDYITSLTAVSDDL